MMANFRSDVALHIKQSVSCADLLARRGLRPDRNGLLLCPFHSEKTPSFRVYQDGKGWYCFGCKRGGDVLTLAEALYECNFPQACKRLDAMFNLGLCGPDERTEAQKRADGAAIIRANMTREKRAERELLKERWGVLNARIFGMQERMKAGEDIDPAKIAELICKRDRIGWKLEGEIDH